MTMISYAQNLEDVVLERVFKHQPTGFYIDVGAWDPDKELVTKHFYSKGWTGINIEPTSYYYQRLLASRPRDINLQVAVGRRTGHKASFLEFEGTGLSALADTANRAALQAAGYAARTVAVDVLPLSEVTDRYAPGQIDILSIDVEGAERSVIESAEWYTFRPRVILVEAIAPLTNEPAWFAWEGLLLEAGYCFALSDGINRFYYRAEQPELRHALCVPANALDDYCPKRFLEVQEILSKRAEFERRHVA